MAAESVVVTIAVSLAAGVLTEVVKKAAGIKSTTVGRIKFAIFTDLDQEIGLLEMKLQKLYSVLSCVQSIDFMQYDNNSLLIKWLNDVRDAVIYADNLLDEVAYEKLRKGVVIQRRRNRFAKLLSNSDTGLRFRIRIREKFSIFESLVAEIHKEAQNTLHLTQLTGNALTSTNQHQPPLTLQENLREMRENPDTSIVMGREAELQLIVNNLCSLPDADALPVVAIVGISGVGKTTLARMVFDNETVRECFGVKVWIFVADNFKLSRFLDEMLQAVTGKSQGLTNITAMEEMLRQCLQELKKDCLLVLDDVWNTDEQLWKSVESSLARATGSTRCIVLVTTQSDRVARVMCASVNQLNDLHDTDAWALFEKFAFARKSQEQLSDLEGVGRRILRKCKGLPLAIRTLGSLLSSMNEKMEWESIERSELWSLSLEQSKIMPWLLIIFYHLPSAVVKQCFVHSSIFLEKGWIVQESDLIQGWMAQGFISSPMGSDKTMEDIAKSYLDQLVANGLLQESTVSNIKLLKMHDLVHDMACFIANDAIRYSRTASDLHTATGAEHIHICSESELISTYRLPKDKKMNKLRTLICYRFTLLMNFESQAKFLRDLRLIDCGMSDVPSSIGRLKHLRYLNLRGNPFRDLPESIGTLFNLQALDLADCQHLCDKPRCIVMLRDFNCLRGSKINIIMPEPNGTLSFAVEDEFEMKELMDLELHVSSVEITELHRLRGKEVDEGVHLPKARIQNLTLRWGTLDQGVTDCAALGTDEVVLNRLHPHSNLKEIVLDGFAGKRLASWIINMNHLTIIALNNCTRCEQLPTLGQLPFLKDLSISGFDNLEVIGVEFYHSTSSTMSRDKHLFPRLEIFRLENMPKLRDWVEPSREYELAFPGLRILEIRYCPMPIPEWMSCLPNLKRFHIEGSDDELEGAHHLPGA